MTIDEAVTQTTELDALVVQEPAQQWRLTRYVSNWLTERKKRRTVVTGDDLRIDRVVEVFHDRASSTLGEYLGPRQHVYQNRAEACRAYVGEILESDLHPEVKRVFVDRAIGLVLTGPGELRTDLYSKLLVQSPREARMCVDAEIPGTEESTGLMGTIVNFAKAYGKRRLLMAAIGTAATGGIYGVMFARDALRGSFTLGRAWNLFRLPGAEGAIWSEAGPDVHELKQRLEHYLWEHDKWSAGQGDEPSIEDVLAYRSSETSERKPREAHRRIARHSRRIAKTHYDGKDQHVENLDAVVSLLVPYALDPSMEGFYEDAKRMVEHLKPVVDDIAGISHSFDQVRAKTPGKMKLVLETALHVGKIASKAQGLSSSS